MELQASLGHLDWEEDILFETHDILHDPGGAWFPLYLTIDDGTNHIDPGTPPWEKETELRLWNYSLELLEDMGIVLPMPVEPTLQDWRLWRMTIALACLKMSGRLKSLELDCMFARTNFHAVFLNLVTAAHRAPSSTLSPTQCLDMSQPDNNENIASADESRRPESTAIHAPPSESWYFQKPLQSLESLRVSFSRSPSDCVGFEDILVYLQLPNLQHLDIEHVEVKSCLLSPAKTRYREENSWVLHKLGMGPLRIPSLSRGSTSLISLRMHCSVLPPQQLHSLIELNKTNTLQTFDYGCYQVAGAYIPHKFIEVSTKHCKESLERFNLRTGHNYNIQGFEMAEEHYIANPAGMYDFSSAALCASFNFVSFERLEVMILPAMLLLNGFGPVTYMKARPNHNKRIWSKLAYWSESDVTALLDLAAVLPSSIRQLGIEVHESQWELLRCYLWRQLSTNSTSESEIIVLPNLQKVRIAYAEDGVATPHELETNLPTYWERHFGFNLDWAQHATPEIPHVSCKWCGGSNGTSLEESGSDI